MVYSNAEKISVSVGKFRGQHRVEADSGNACRIRPEKLIFINKLIFFPPDSLAVLWRCKDARVGLSANFGVQQTTPRVHPLHPATFYFGDNAEKNCFYF